MGHGGDAGEVLQHVESGAFGRQKPARLPRDRDDGAVGPDDIAVARLNVELNVRHQPAEDSQRDGQARHHDAFAGDQRRFQRRFLRNDRKRRDIPVADILVEHAVDEILDRRRVQG